MEYDEQIKVDFSPVAEYYENKEIVKMEIQAILKKINKVSHVLSCEFAVLYQRDGLQKIQSICKKGHAMFVEVRGLISKLSTALKKIPQILQYKYKGSLASAIIHLLYIASYIKFLESHSFLTQSEAHDILGIVPGCDVIWRERYLLYGWFQLAFELPNLARGAATSGEYDMIFVISKTLNDLSRKCIGLPLSHENISKKLQQLKYSIAKVRLILYDLSVRKLISMGATKSLASELDQNSVTQNLGVQNMAIDTVKVVQS